MTTAQEEIVEYGITTVRKTTRQELKDLIDCVPDDDLIVVKRMSSTSWTCRTPFSNRCWTRL